MVALFSRSNKVLIPLKDVNVDQVESDRIKKLGKPQDRVSRFYMVPSGNSILSIPRMIVNRRLPVNAGEPPGD